MGAAIHWTSEQVSGSKPSAATGDPSVEEEDADAEEAEEEEAEG
jgi:hypothetical protein